MTTANQKLHNPTAEAKKELEKLDVQPHKTIEVVDATNHAPYKVDITPVLLQQPHSPFAIALSLSIIIGAIAHLRNTRK